MTSKDQRKRKAANKVYSLLLESTELGTYTRPFLRSWRQKHFPKAEFEFLLSTRTPEQIAKHMMHFARTNKKSWAGQIRTESTAFDPGNYEPCDVNELRAEDTTFIVLREPDQDGKILILHRKEGT